MILTLLMLATNVCALDFVHSRGEGTGQTVMLSCSTPTELLMVPTGGLARGEWRIESGYSHQYGMSDLDQLFVAGAWRYRSLTAAFGYSSFGKSDLYSETTGKFSLAWHRDSLSIGINGSGRLLQFGGDYENLSATTFGVGVSYRFDRLLFAASGDNLTSPKFYEWGVAAKPVYALYAEYKGQKAFSITGRATLEKGQSAQLALGQKIHVSDNSAIFWGLATEPLKYGAGFELDVAGSLVSYAFSNHPDLGITHTIAVSYGIGRPASGRGDDFK